MRISYISEACIPSRTANSMQVMKMCQAMVQRGHDVLLLAPRRTIPADMRRVDLWHHYGVQRPFKIRWLTYPPGPFGGHLYALFALAIAFASRPDLIYARHLPSSAMAALAGVSVICELHEMPGGRSGPGYLRLFLQRSSPRSSLVTISHALKRDVSATYGKWIDRQRVVVVPDGVDLEMFKDLPDTKTARRQLGLALNGPVAGYAGHFYPGKGLEVILRLARECPRVNFMLMGGQPREMAALQKQLSEERVKNVHPLGFVPNAELPSYLAAADVLLLPIQRKVCGSGGGDIARWTSPMKLFEYMACGRLIIASDLPVLREVLNDTNALLCEPDDLGAWQESLERGLADEVLRHGLSHQARNDAQRYAWTRRVDTCLQTVQCAGRDLPC